MNATAGSLLLQPSLLDRLIGTIQMVTLFDIQPRQDAFADSGLDRVQLEKTLVPLGLTPVSQAGGPPWRYSAAGRTVSLSDLNRIRLVSSGSATPVPLEKTCSISARMAPAAS